MPKHKYENIYQDMKEKIESYKFKYQELLPSENNLIEIYACSRNTLRRAIQLLVVDGYVQTIKGKGIRNIYRPTKQTTFTLGEIESFDESAHRNGKIPKNKVLLFTEITVDKNLSKKSGFDIGEKVFYIQRLHYLNNKPLIINHNYFMKKLMPELSKEIAEKSIYNYLENTLHINIVNSKRIMTIEKITEIDEKYLNMDVNDYNCMAVVTSYTYDNHGTMFEYTESRHKPNYFRFQDNAIRREL